MLSRFLVEHAHRLASETHSKAILLHAGALDGNEALANLIRGADFPVILFTRNPRPRPMGCTRCTWVTVPNVPMNRAGQVKIALLVSLAKGLLQPTDRVVCLTGFDGSNSLDTLMLVDLATERELFSSAQAFAFGNEVNPNVFERLVALATRLAVEGREGRPVGLIFVLGDSHNVLNQSRNLVRNPFHGYPERDRNLLDPNLEETIKQFAALDGAFVIRDDGIILTAAAQLMPTRPAPALTKGLGTRHSAAAGITLSSHAVAVVVSQSTGTVTVFKHGRIVTEIHRPVNGSAA